MAEKFKYVNIKGRNYRVGKYDVTDATFIVFKVAGLLAPMLGSLIKGTDVQKAAAAISKPEDFNLGTLDIVGLLSPLSQIPEDDFKYLQYKSLKACAVKFTEQAGYVPLLHDNGTLSVEGLEDDPMSVMMLMFHTLWHNLSGFFDGAPLEGLLNAMQDMKPSIPQT